MEARIEGKFLSSFLTIIVNDVVALCVEDSLATDETRMQHGSEGRPGDPSQGNARCVRAFLACMPESHPRNSAFIRG